MDEALIRQAAQLHQQAEQFEQHLAFIDSQVSELEAFSKNLLVFKESNSPELLASLGKGIFTKTTLDSKELFVEVGAGIIVKKQPVEVLSIIDSQIINLRESRMLILEQLTEHTSKLQELMHLLEQQEPQ
ncbi:prefoldin subunit alpha [Candidatus Pacearchaeota archaeon]|nr:prefoldin subunit alpha [Candidatus Pacearchaeota archaeon]